jgi:hypothetical protein
VPTGAPRARLVENSTGLRQQFSYRPARREVERPRAGAVPETMARQRHSKTCWRAMLRQRSLSPRRSRPFPPAKFAEYPLVGIFPGTTMK